MHHFAANYIFDGDKLIKNAFVSVDDNGVIKYVSKENEALTEQPFMMFLNGILCPGFVNAHCHLELSDINKNDVNTDGLGNFIASMIKSRSRETDFKKLKTADDVMFLKGVNLCGDIVNTRNTIEIKENSKIKYLNFIEQSGIDDRNSNERYNQALELSILFNEKNLENTIVPHSFYSVADKLLKLIAAKCEDKTFSIHFLESQEEFDLFQNQSGNLYQTLKNIFPLYNLGSENITELYKKLDLFETARSLILVHNVKTEIKYLHNTINVSFCLCPSSNLKLNSELPSHEFVYANKDRLVVGTDSLASTDKLDIWNELKIISENYSELSLTELLRMITSNGAKALGIKDFGKLNCETSPGLVLICDADLQSLKPSKNSYIKRIL
jgi:cytosine/adenosine deaminase-related metal-dependent hydrolase